MRGYFLGAVINTTLSKPGGYNLYGGTLPADGAMIRRARWLLTGACVLTVAIVLAPPLRILAGGELSSR